MKNYQNIYMPRRRRRRGQRVAHLSTDQLPPKLVVVAVLRWRLRFIFVRRKCKSLAGVAGGGGLEREREREEERESDK